MSRRTFWFDVTDKGVMLYWRDGSGPVKHLTRALASERDAVKAVGTLIDFHKLAERTRHRDLSRMSLGRPRAQRAKSI